MVSFVLELGGLIKLNVRADVKKMTKFLDCKIQVKVKKNDTEVFKSMWERKCMPDLMIVVQK